MGGCGDYFDVADRVIAMRDYRPADVTEDARRVAAELPSARRVEARSPLRIGRPRRPLPQSFDASRGRRDVKIDARGTDAIRYGATDVDLRGLEQLVDPSQTRAVGLAIHRASATSVRDGADLPAILDELETFFDREGLDALDPFHRPGRHPGNLARPRRFEVAGAINRLRSLRCAGEADEED